MATPLSAGAQQLLRDTIPSVLHLDVLLQLYADRLRWSDGKALAYVLRVAPEPVIRALEQLAAHNLLDVKLGGSVLYRLAPCDDAVGEAIAEIAARHYEDRDAVVALLRPPAPATDAAKRFADAFRLRGKRADG